jgi:hypothetical protein
MVHGVIPTSVCVECLFGACAIFATCSPDPPCRLRTHQLFHTLSPQVSELRRYVFLSTTRQETYHKDIFENVDSTQDDSFVVEKEKISIHGYSSRKDKSKAHHIFSTSFTQISVFGVIKNDFQDKFFAECAIEVRESKTHDSDIWVRQVLSIMRVPVPTGKRNGRG